MSRIGKKAITIPTQAKVETTAGVFTVSGPQGTVRRQFGPDITITIDGQQITLVPVRQTLATAALWGTYAAHLNNMIKGVTTGFTKKLILEGVGYKVNLTNGKLVFDIGFSHEVPVEIPKELKVTAEKNFITITGADKDQVGQFAAKLFALKPVEPYKGKGMRYEGQKVRRKQGKKTVG